MVQGTASSAGKSILVAALCRIFRQDGYSVAPFKSQNMALNSFATRDGDEIGRAQAVQAEAAGIEPSVLMNPVLLKPEADSRSQVVVMGKPYRTIDAREYYRHTPALLKIVKSSLKKLLDTYDIVVLEGAGSPAEINLRQREIVNMRIARLHSTPVLLAGDIDRGGVFASLLGTLSLLTPRERELVQGLVINKFRGDLSLLTGGLRTLERRAKKPVLGVVPYIHDIGIAQEDSVYLDEHRPSTKARALRVAVIRLPHISNYDDFDPLISAGCRVEYVKNASGLQDPHLVVLPGTKSTIADLNFLKESGLASAITRLAAVGTPVIGICGGFQMLGKRILDEDNTESADSRATGLGLLDVETRFRPDKATHQVTARAVAGHGLFDGLLQAPVTGYEIHMGQTLRDVGQPVFQVTDTPHREQRYTDGAINTAGTVFGTYLHGLFGSEGFRGKLLANLRRHWGLEDPGTAFTVDREAAYDRLAATVRENVDMGAIYRLLGL
ncbi:cobyric acid synthase [Chloroflexota bacterium]